MAKRLLRKALSAPGLLRVVRGSFNELNDPVPSRRFSLSECLMSGLAVFGLKYASLLRFDRDACTDEVVRANLSSLYGIERAQCDTALRERLDEVNSNCGLLAVSWDAASHRTACTLRCSPSRSCRQLMISKRLRACGLPFGLSMRIRLLGDFAVSPPSS